MISLQQSLLLLVIALTSCRAQFLERQTCDAKRSEATIQAGADALLGGILTMHEMGTGGYGCGETVSDMQSYEAIRYTLDLLNKKDQILNGEYLKDTYVPGIKLGMIVRDYCDHKETAVYSAEGFFPQLSADQRSCKKSTTDLMLGIVGAYGSDETKDVAKIAEKFSIPVISYSATAPILSSPDYPTFMRTVPPDGPLMTVIVKVLQKLDWNFVVVVYTDSTNGHQSYQEIKPRLYDAGICLTAAIATDPKDVSDQAMDRVLNQILKTHDTTIKDSVVGVLYFGTPPVANALLTRARVFDLSRTGRLQWIFTDSLTLSKAFPTIYPRGVLSIVPTSRYIVEFEDHWVRINESNPSPENPWFKEWYETQNKCRLPGNTNNDFNTLCTLLTEREKRLAFIQDPYVEPAVHSIFTYAKALRTAQQQLCGNTPGVCENLRKMTSKTFLENYLMKVDFTYSKLERVPSLASDQYAPYFSAARVKFDAVGDIVNPVYDIWNYNDVQIGGGSPGFKFRRVGTYINNKLDLDMTKLAMYDTARLIRLPQIPKSPCPRWGCRPCMTIVPSTKYLYIHGDVIVNGIFSVHLRGKEGVSCGDFDLNTRSGIQYMEAMVYALGKVRQRKTGNPNYLRGVSLGGLAFDDCSSSTRSQDLISQVQRGTLMVKDASGNVLDPRKVDAYTAAHTSSLTIPIAELMNSIKRPVIGYTSASTALTNRAVYPYYLRVHPGLDEGIRAIIALLKKFGWYYVQTIKVSADAYSTNGNAEFRRMAAKEGICVVAMHELTKDIVKQLRYRPSVRPVVIIAQEWHHRQFLESIAAANSAGEFSVIASITWGNSQNIVKGLESAADGVISLKWKTPPLTSFQAYLRSLNPQTYKTNPWFAEWYEIMFNCSLDSNNMRKYSVMCSSVNTKPVTDSSRFELTDYTIFVINAIYAIADGLDKTLQDLCGTSYNGICGNFQNAPNKGVSLLENIRKARFQVEDTNPAEMFSFVENEGNVPFNIYNYQRGSVNAYVKTNEFVPSTNELLSFSDVKLYGGQAPSAIQPSCPAFCLECMYLFLGQKYMYIDGDLVIPAIFDVHYAGTTQFTCGNIRKSDGFQYTEAFAFALDWINSGSSVKLNGVKLGGLALDGCSSSLRATTLVNSLQSNNLVLQDQNNMPINNRKFLSYLTYDSKSTIDVADILSAMGMPIVSPGATSPVLANKKRFSTFFRTIPSDKHIARGMAVLAKEVGFNYVITLNAPDAGNRATKDEFRQLASDQGVCVLASYEFVTDGNMNIILRSIYESTTKVVVVFADPYRYIEDMLTVKQQLYPNTRFIFIANRKWSVPSSLTNMVDQSISFNLNTPTIPQFITYLSARRPTLTNKNPWFQEFYQARFSCNLPGNFIGNNQACPPTHLSLTSGKFEQDIWVLSTVNAVFALAEGVRMTLVEKCGASYSGICAKYRNDIDTNTRLMANMDALNFTDLIGEIFQFVEREANKGFTVMQYLTDGSQTKQGTFMSSKLNLVDGNALRNGLKDIPSKCDRECLICQSSNTNFADFSYISGDLYIAGLFDVHKQGGTPYTCGDINTKHGFQLLEAFNYAIEYVNNKTGIFKDMLNGVILGGIGLDTCQSPTRAANLVANIHSRNINLRKGQVTVNPRGFDVYIGTLETESSLRVADILSTLSIPQISYGATSLELQDLRRYRYFLRTVPADDKQARAIISYLKRFNVDNVQVISTFDSVGEEGKKEFLRLAYLNRICVSQNITIGEKGPVSPGEAGQALSTVKSNEEGKVVVLFVDDPRPILQAAENDEGIRQKYFFIGTDKWGLDKDMLVGLDRLIQNRKSVTFDIESADLPGFDKYLENKIPANYKRNPWFREFYQKIYDCSLTAPTSEYAKTCPSFQMGISRSDGYVQDPYVLYVVNAVFSAAIGIHNALQELCGVGDTQYYSNACNLFRESGERRQYIYRGIRRANFTDATQQPFYFTPGGESDRGYHIYEPVRNPTGVGYVYEDVGSYNDTDYLKIDIRYDVAIKSDCSKKGACVCPFPEYQPSRYMLKNSPNDLNIVFVGDIHSRSSTNPFQCGAFNTVRAFQNLMAFFYAIESVNKNTNRRLPASLKLGGLALDACGARTRMGQDVYSLMSGDSLCDSGLTGQIISPSTIIAFIGDSSGTSIPLSNILSPMKVTTMSQSATSVVLSNKQFHPYFLRTVPPDDIQVRVMLEIMKNFNWDYATVVYEDSAYGISAKNTILNQVNGAGRGACISSTVGLKLDMTLANAEQIVEKLSQQVGSRLIILFTSPEQSRLLLQATKSKGLTNQFVWLASDSWARSQYIVNGLEEEAAGAITIEIQSEVVYKFQEYLKSLTLTNRLGMPDDWFEEMYQILHKCQLRTSVVKKDFSKICSGQEGITDEMIPQDTFVLHTIISVYIIAQGLNNIDVCRASQLEVSACLSQQQAKKRDLIYNGILNAQWNVLPNELHKKSFSFSFTDAGYGDIRYEIYNYHRDQQQDKYIYKKIGSYKNTLTIDRTAYSGISILSTGILPISRCPTGTICLCLNANGIDTHPYEHLPLARAGALSSSSSSNSIAYITKNVILGADGKYYDLRTGKQLKDFEIPGVTDRFFQIWAIVVATLAGVGVFVSLCMFIYLLVVYPVRGGTSILGYLLSFGIILMYALVFAFIAHATTDICGLRRFALGFVYALCYGSLFVKLLDCWRAREKEDMFEVKYNKLGKPCGLLMVVVLLVCVQIIINTEWLILREPGVTKILYKNMAWPRCMPDDFYDEGLVLSLVYVMFLILLSVIFGFCTFSSPNNHYESRWILGIAVLSIPCWVIWCLVATIGVYKVRDAAVAIGLLINATFMLLCGPLRKLYLLNKYQVLMEEEEHEYERAMDSQGGDGDYASSYGRQYDNIPRLHDGSVRGSTLGSHYPSQYRYTPSQVGTQRSTGSGYRIYEDPGPYEDPHKDQEIAY